MLFALNLADSGKIGSVNLNICLHKKRRQASLSQTKFAVPEQSWQLN